MPDQAPAPATPGTDHPGGTGTAPPAMETSTPARTTADTPPGKDDTEAAKSDTAPPVKPDTDAASKPGAVPKPLPGAGVKPDADTPAQPDAGVKVLFGVVFDINGKTVPVVTDDLLDIPTKGIEFALPEKVSLGSIADAKGFMQRQCGVDTGFLVELPGPLDAVVTKLEELDFTVDTLHVKIPGSREPEAHAQYTVKMSAMWTPPVTDIVIVEGFAARGVVSGVSTETLPAAGTGGTAAPS